MPSSKVVLLGDRGVGKTMLVAQFVHKKFSTNYSAGLEANLCTYELEDSKKIKITDCPGDEKYIKDIVQDADVVILTVDVSRKNTFESAKTTWLKHAREHYPNAQLILAGNKLDIENGIQVSKEEMQQFAEEIGASYFLTTAKANINVKALFSKAHQLAQQSYAADDTSAVVDKDNAMRINHKMLIVGPQGAGKTSISKSFLKNEFSTDTKSTIGVDLGADKKYHVQLWDTAGAEQYRTVTSAFYSGAEAILLVFDLSQGNALRDLEPFLRLIVDKAPDHVPVILVGNKSDLERQVNQADINALVNQHAMNLYVETSAKDGTNITYLFEEALRLVREQKEFELIVPKDNPSEENPCLTALANYQQILAQLTEDARFKKNKIKEGMDKAIHLGEEIDKGLDLRAVNRILSNNTDHLLDNRNATGVKWYKVKSFFKGKRNELMNNRYCESKTEELLVDLRESLMGGAI